MIKLNLTSIYFVKNHIVFNRDFEIIKKLINAAFGYNLTSSVAVELEASYLKGAALTTSHYVLNPSPNYLDQKVELKGTSYTVIPSLVISIQWNILSPYLRFGPMIGYSGLSETINQEATVPGGTAVPQISRSKVELEFEDSFVFGINASVGSYINLNESIAFSVDVASKTLSYSPSKITLEKYSLDGVDRTYQIPQEDSEMEYVETYNSIDKNKVTQVEHPFNSLVFSVGLKIGL